MASAAPKIIPSTPPLSSLSSSTMSEEKFGDVLEKAITASELGDNGAGHLEPLDLVEDKRILRKIDWHLIPFVSFLYLLSFLDRSNIGNAKIVGLITDLKLKGVEYNICAAVFFITYAFAEIPSNIALKLFRPSIWIPSIMLAWGIVMTLMSQVHNYYGLLAARLFLGLAESGLFPGVNFFLTLWYCRRELAFRIALFYASVTVAGAFGGLLSAALAKLDGKGGLHGWQWIFLIEGLFTVIVSIVSYFYMHDYPATAKFLTEPERAHVVERIKRDHPGLATHVHMRFVFQALKDYKSYLFILIYFGLHVPVYAYSLFLPTIINGLGYTAGRAQLMSVPPYVGGCLFTVAVGYYSDKFCRRGIFVVIFATVAMVGYIILLTAKSNGSKYAGAFIAALGVYSTVPPAISWVGNNTGGDLKRGVVIAMMIGIGNLGGICSSFIYVAEEAPHYRTGHAVCVGALAMTIITSLFMMWNFNRLNKRNIARCEAQGLDRSRNAEFSEMGDSSPLFRYTL